jgi:uncharacterized protein (DUF849 family)
MTNEFVNVHFSDLRKHKELQWLLLQLVGTGKNFFHEFIRPGKKGKKNKIKQWLMEVLPTTKERDIDTLIELNTIEGIKDYATQHGISDKQIKKILNLLLANIAVKVLKKRVLLQSIYVSQNVDQKCLMSLM